MQIEGEAGAEGAVVETANDDHIVSVESFDPNEGEQKEKTPEPEQKPKQDKLPDEPKGDEGESSEPKKRGRGWFKKLEAKDDIIRRKDQENEQLRQELARFKGQNQPQDQQQPKTERSESRPNLSDFDDVDDYFGARVEKILEGREKAATEAKAREQYLDSKAAMLDSINASDPELAETISNHEFVVSKQFDEILLQSPVAADVVMAMKADPNYANGLRSLSPENLSRALAVAEYIVQQAKTSGSADNAAGRQTRAAAPINPVRSGSTAGSTSLEDADYETFVAKRNKDLRAQGR